VAFPSNRPQLDAVKRQIKLAPSVPTDDADFDELVNEILDASIADVEDKAATSFDGVELTEVYDGTGGNTLMLRRHPILAVPLVKVELPVLALTRTYAADEIKIYPWQGEIVIFTYKLAAENASLHLDQQVYGNLIPRGLPQVAHVTYCYGFAQYDPDTDTTRARSTAARRCSRATSSPPTRAALFRNRLRQLQRAAVCDAAASVLAQAAGLGAGVLQSVSFDGFSQSTNPQAYGPQVQALVEQRDALLARRKRLFIASVP
jgi:hypothetical protein